MGSAVCRLPFFFLYNRASLKSRDGGGGKGSPGKIFKAKKSSRIILYKILLKILY